MVRNNYIFLLIKWFLILFYKKGISKQTHQIFIIIISNFNLCQFKMYKYYMSYLILLIIILT